jgi:hypothetical protein
MLGEIEELRARVVAAEARVVAAEDAKRSAAGYSVYLLYWYKSTHTDAEGAAERERS